MTIYYVNSAAGGTADGLSWTNAFLTLGAAAAVDAAGDTVYVKNTHSETTAGTVSHSWAGTVASPTRILCVSDAGEPPTTLATGAVVACTGANNMTPAATGYVYMYGIRFKAGDSTNAADIILTNGSVLSVYESCAFELAGDNSGSDYPVGTSSAVELINCTFKSINSGSRFLPNIAKLTMRGCSAESGTLANSLLEGGPSNIVLLEGCDFSAMPTGLDIVTVGGTDIDVVMRNCKLPSGWTGSVFDTGSTLGSGAVVKMHNCAAGDTNYALEVKTEFGTVTHETSIYRTAGASNGTTNLSWKMVSGANAEWMHQTLDSPEIVIWNTAVGSAKTITIEFVTNGAGTLYKEDVWMEVQHLGTSGVPLSVFDNDSRLANYLTAQATTACDAGTGTGNWTNPPGSSTSYKLVSTITPQEVGFIHVVVKLAKASTTIYVDPKITIA